MPKFDYKCVECEEEVEVKTAAFNVEPDTICPHCSGQMKKVYVKSNVFFKLNL